MGVRRSTEAALEIRYGALTDAGTLGKHVLRQANAQAVLVQ